MAAAKLRNLPGLIIDRIVGLHITGYINLSKSSAKGKRLSVSISLSHNVSDSINLNFPPSRKKSILSPLDQPTL
jgi:hypothetical protein